GGEADRCSENELVCQVTQTEKGIEGSSHRPAEERQPGRTPPRAKSKESEEAKGCERHRDLEGFDRDLPWGREHHSGRSTIDGYGFDEGQTDGSGRRRGQSDFHSLTPTGPRLGVRSRHRREKEPRADNAKARREQEWANQGEH